MIIGCTGNYRKSEYFNIINHINDFLSQNNIKCIISSDLYNAEYIDKDNIDSSLDIVEFDELEKLSDIILCIGGDGTFLSTARRMNRADTPLLGIHIGGLGFLAEVSRENMDKSLEFYTNFFLQNQILVKTDRLSMMNSLEVRSPILDKELIDCTRKIPNKLKLKGNIGKYILKRGFEKKFGKKFTYRKKIGFSAPISNWLINKNIDFNLNSNFLSKKKQILNKKFNEHCSYKKENRIYLWNIMNLDNFLNKNGY